MTDKELISLLTEFAETYYGSKPTDRQIQLFIYKWFKGHHYG